MGGSHIPETWKCGAILSREQCETSQLEVEMAIERLRLLASLIISRLSSAEMVFVATLDASRCEKLRKYLGGESALNAHLFKPNATGARQRNLTAP
ncbi:MAG: hypothetical protein JWM11_1212 [Planctomycetaceae bacterium]|nr:hypothetical protein [Planctomycetaceae bacterium]